MDKFLGKWKLIPHLWVGFDQWADAMQVSEEIRKEMRKLSDVTIECSQETADTYRKDGLTFKLDVPVTFEYHGVAIKSKMTLKDGQLLGEFDMGGSKFSSISRVVGNIFFNEDVCKGVSQIQVFEKME